MPFKMKRKFRKTKKIGKKKRVPVFKYKLPAVVRNKTSVNLGQGFPKKMTFTHKYMDTESLLCTAGALDIQSFHCNGMFKPNQTNTGHQPMFYDQMAALYNHYTVIGSKISIKIMPGSTTQAASCIGIFINDDATVTPTEIRSLNENTTSRYKFLPIGVNNTTTLTKKWSAKKIFGGSILANVDLEGLGGNASGVGGTNPTEQSLFSIYMAPLDAVSTVSAFIECSITYIAVWKELKDLTGS